MRQPSVWLEFSPLAHKTSAINLGQGFPDWAPPKFIQEAAVNAVQGSEFSTYARSAGHPSLVNAIAHQYSPRFDRQLKANTEILVSVGASEALFLGIMNMAKPGDEVIVFEPAFDIYYGALAMSGATVKPVQLIAESSSELTSSSQLTIDWQGLKQQLSQKTTLMIINTPHNPTGKVLTRDEISQLASILEDFPNCQIISDEVYEHLVYDNKDHLAVASLPQLFDRTLTIYSAGKSFSVTGWKVGWAIGPEHLISKLQHTQQWVVFSVATPLQEAVAHALGQGQKDYADNKNYYDWLKDHYENKRDLLFNGLKKAGLNPMLPEGSFFILCDIRHQPADFCQYPEELTPLITSGHIQQDSTTKELKDYNFCRNLSLKKGVTGIPTSAFYSKATRDENANWARFAFCKSDEVLLKALRMM